MHIRANFGRFSKGKGTKFCTLCSHNRYIAFFVSSKYLGNRVNVFLRIHNGDCHSIRLFKNMIVRRENAVFGQWETRSTPRVPMGATSAFIQPRNNECGRLAQFIKTLWIKDKGSDPGNFHLLPDRLRQLFVDFSKRDSLVIFNQLGDALN